jgi:hypothetical protein
MLKKLRAKFVKEHGEEEAEKLLAKEETEIERALDLYVLRGYYSWSAMMVSLKDGHSTSIVLTASIPFLGVDSSGGNPTSNGVARCSATATRGCHSAAH